MVSIGSHQIHKVCCSEEELVPEVTGGVACEVHCAGFAMKHPVELLHMSILGKHVQGGALMIDS